MSKARTHLRLWVAALAALAALALATTAHADYEQVGNFARSGSGEQLRVYGSRDGVAVNSTGAGGVEAGSVYVTSGGRVSRYSPSGEIKEVWGWGTIASGPDLPNQVSRLTVSATSGSYELKAQTAIGRGKSTTGSKVLTEVSTETGAFHVGDEVSFVDFPPGTKITAVGADTLELSEPSSSGTLLSVLGRITAHETTAAIPYSADAAELKAALVALPAFGEGDVSVTGGSGDEEGHNPYEITFEGAYTGSPVYLDSVESTLEGGNPSSSATIATTTRAFTPGFQRCRVDNGDTCSSQESNSNEGEGVGQFTAVESVAVDQATGYVYVLNAGFAGKREHNLIEVLSADGSESIARFGDAPGEGETVETDPEKVNHPQSIAVGETGNVYVGAGYATGYERRVMCFRPEAPSDYEHYVYCGRAQDVGVGFGPVYLSLDDAGHLYIASLEFIAELSAPEASATTLCTYKPNGQASGVTADPLTGEVFYFNGVKSDQSIHRLKPCDQAKGKFEEAQTPIKVSPAASSAPGQWGLAINPAFTWGSERPKGVLYGASGFTNRTEGVVYRGLGYIFAPAEVHPPSIESESVSNTRTASTILHAAIDPHGFVTRYVFQYLSEAQYEANEPGERFAGATEAPAGGGEIAGSALGEPGVAIAGLAPDTAYRFRVIATSECNVETGEPCVTDGEAFSFATYPLFPPGLPDHRAYELVSPAQKHGGEVIPAEPTLNSCPGSCKPSGYGTVFPMQSSPDGGALAYEGQPFTPFEGATRFDSYVARRTEEGWQSTALIPGLPPGQVSQLAFDRTLGHGLLDFEAAGDMRLEIQDTSVPSSTTSLVVGTNHRSAGEFSLSYGGHSADFSRQFFAANDSLTGETPYAPEPPDPGVSKKDLYEWHEGRLTLVNVLPGNATVATGAELASLSPDTHAVSEDGSKVFFEDETGNLYVREGGEATKQIADPAHFLSASADGSEVLLTDGCLYSLASEGCTDLTEGMGGFKGIAGQSKDLSRIYFVDGEVLAPGAEAGSCTRAPGGSQGAKEEQEGEVPPGYACNLYFHEAGSATQFIATLPAITGTEGATSLADWVANPAARTAEASPNGRFLAFASRASLTGYDNVGPCGREFNPEIGEFETILAPCREAFLYDSATGKLLCASCNPTGEAPLGPTTLRRISGSPERLPQPRYLTDEGRLYFDTQDSLVARDTNEGVEDVYEYSPKGAGAMGTCERDAGCTRLISAGTEPVDSNLIAVDETGRNVFFDTRDQLALKDKDELLDIYDAREGGGIGAETEVARAECQGEACLAPVYAPNDATPASSSFEGPGNPKEARAKKKHKKKRHKKAHHRHAHKHGKHGKRKRHHARAAKRNHGGAK